MVKYHNGGNRTQGPMLLIVAFEGIHYITGATGMLQEYYVYPCVVVLALTRITKSVTT